MDVKEGHPGAVFHWFFDTDQGTNQVAQILMMLHGSGQAIANLAQACLKKQSEFDDALGPEVLFLFFDPGVSASSMSKHGVALRRRFRETAPANFLFAGSGEAYPLPTSLVEVGRKTFRSERPGAAYFEKIAGQVAASNKRAVPFFQQTFGLVPRQNYLLIAQQRQQTLQTYELGDTIGVSVEDMLELVRVLRLVAGHPKGAGDLEAIKAVTTAQINRGAIRSATQLLWNKIRPTIRSLPH